MKTFEIGKLYQDTAPNANSLWVSFEDLMTLGLDPNSFGLFEQGRDYVMVKPNTVFLLLGTREDTEGYLNECCFWAHVLIGDRTGWMALDGEELKEP